ncbi:MAG: CAP domain-containing protein [Verrucomicrobiota bacterium]|nr:CAP domain-containing protein [Verrucomicrobiota bacterium]
MGKLLKLWLCLGCAWACLAAQPKTVETNSLQSRVYFLTTQQYFASPLGKESILPEKINYHLLGAAIFHETNRRRIGEKLSPLQTDTKSIMAAEMHAISMARFKFIDHVNKFETNKSTLEKRMTLAGITPRFGAENLAMTFALQYESGRQFHSRTNQGKKNFSYTPRGPVIPPHTYRSFAQALVEQWLKSPGHRENLLDTRPRYLGCAARLSMSETGMPLLYSVQVFYSPLQ